MTIEARLREFCRAQSVSLSEDQIRALVLLDRLHTRWSRAAGLSAFRSEGERFARYFAEPLQASLWSPEVGPAWDIGTGGGTPALPLAVVRRALRWNLVEPNHKKCVFLEEAARELGLTGCRVIRGRLENVTPAEPAVLVTSRGLALDRERLARLGEWLEPDGRILLFTGETKARALAMPSGLELVESVALAPEFRTRLLVIRPRLSPLRTTASGPARQAARSARGERGS